jgi:hypothetical protein
MKIFNAGHGYRVENLDVEKHGDEAESFQTLYFVKRSGDNFPFNNGTQEGTNCQEVLRVLINRSEYLQSQKPCAETESIIGLLRAALLLFELRAARNHGHALELRDTQELMSGKTCKTCGHIKCEQHKD